MAGSALLLASACAQARRPGAVTFDLPSQDLGASLRAVAARAHLNVAAPSDLVANRQAPALSGDYTAAEAIDRLLEGSGLHAEQTGSAIIVRGDAAHAAAGQTSIAQDEVVVTGSLIRGAPIASPVIRTTQDEIRNLGRTDLGQVIREIPQNFGGGQNPGIGQPVPSASGADIGGGSALNLRGLGSDATLTLLNGHRLAYTAVFQSVDISAIPVDILDRIEIVPDGASALYGSDAVAGVANIILKRDFDGLQLSTSLGKATEGGDFEQRYGAMGGARWPTGGLIVAVEHGRSSEIRSEQRSYAKDNPGQTLFPPLRHDSAVATGHQAIGSALTLSFDALYNDRRASNDYVYAPRGDPSDSHGTWRSKDRSAAVAPTLEYAGAQWRARLVTSYGWEKVDYSASECDFGVCGPTGSGYYRNREYSAELGGDGDLFSWAGGTAKLALGGGYRGIGFERYNGPDAANLNTRHTQDSYFAYGEVSLPLIGKANALAFLTRASVSAALRYERYPGIGQIVTPKLGLIAGPTPDFDLKLSWGKSFRAPTLYEQYQPRSVYLYEPAWVGRPEAPANESTLVLLGGNRALKPERATTFSATFDLHPRDTRFDLAATFYRVSYRNRIVAPIRFLSNALIDPSYAAQVTRNPTAAEIAATIASGATFLNYTDAAFDPAMVDAIIDDGNINAGRVDVRGLDLLVSYVLPIGRHAIAMSGDIGYIASDRRVTIDAPVETLAGTIFSPPHGRGRGTASWRAGPVTLTGDVNYTGGVRDTRGTPNLLIGGMTTVGLTARWRIAAASRWLDGFDMSISAQNLLDAKPRTIVTRSPQDLPYDSTNYSPIGRFLSIAVRKTW
ncbi:TonB-dependent receptor [Sphingomonas crusticola]|uniref:TonB-dependent receptor n=1 Tax=Sphingomonas crusticola TaxID=1697973 RepID=UPI0013C317FA|nr:TonB-dependent receptor [Sphingomonas crusticola]